jgi:hypothetical protein
MNDGIEWNLAILVLWWFIHSCPSLVNFNKPFSLFIFLCLLPLNKDTMTETKNVIEKVGKWNTLYLSCTQTRYYIFSRCVLNAAAAMVLFFLFGICFADSYSYVFYILLQCIMCKGALLAMLLLTFHWYFIYIRYLLYC